MTHDKLKHGWAMGDAPKRRYTRSRFEEVSPEVIAERCAEIQAGWTEAERARRQVGGNHQWRLPNYEICRHAGGNVGFTADDEKTTAQD